MWPITAYWARCQGFGSMLAPTSSRIVRPRLLGSTTAMAGRSTPGSTPIVNIAMAMAAPVFPAEMNAAASPSRTSEAATRIEESRLRRRACEGCSPDSTTWEACRTVIGKGLAPLWRASSRSTCGLVADEDDLDAVLAAARDRPLDADGDAAVPSHRVDGDPHRLVTRRRGHRAPRSQAPSVETTSRPL